ncbi:hypothetical protein BDB00DRAFT_804708 [Zychaea mexicana]|uniref:uncharacterized protein n=1 Tax=Zychaea mexicana TaxID=64656 RepID=UPI0022FE6511|nr:uncharacterized protein BDB00DRAFT_804708 [Zychaea mexicana]KAI9497490.1 hypothetical protein BDB00DRAFT_804708 [Zychaea mexicana]
MGPPTTTMKKTPSRIPLLMEQAGIPPSLRPALLTALRAYGLTWSITTVPGIIGVFVKALLQMSRTLAKTSSLLAASAPLRKTLIRDVPLLLNKSFSRNGFPYIMVGAFTGHHFLTFVLQHHLKPKVNIRRKTAVFLTAAASMLAVRRAFPNTKTLDFTFFALVRALDVLAHQAYDAPMIKNNVPAWMLDYGSVGVFTVACTEIMFTWFYQPELLPRSYSLWITKMSEMDDRLLKALRAIRNREWIYGKDTGLGDLLGDYAVGLGLPREMGNPMRGRIPCQLVHQGQPYGCEVYSMNRFIKGFIRIFPLYFAVHLAPHLLFRTARLMQNPSMSLLHILKAATRSSAFLASFITIIWYSICLTRTRIGHQLLNINQTRLDDTTAPLIGSMLCGLSLLLESRHRRGEMALYVVPRAMYSLTERVLGPYQKGRWWEPVAAEGAETLLFAGSVTIILSAMFKNQSNVRSSARGLLSWILKSELPAEEMKEKEEEEAKAVPENDHVSL